MPIVKLRSRARARVRLRVRQCSHLLVMHVTFGHDTMVDSKYIFTVFTPTYNRASTLDIVFESLMKQTVRKLDGLPVFEWLIVDDGSVDNTKEIIKHFQQKADFPIRYHFQENAGKHMAINRGVELAKGRFFLIADSDDAFVPQTLSVLYRYWKGLTEQQKKVCAGVACLAKNGYTGEIIGNNYLIPAPVLTYELPYNLKHRRHFEMWGFLRLDIIKKYPFPDIKGETFIPEGVVWNKICRNHKRLITHNALRIVYHRKDGFTKNVKLNYVRHASGFYLYYITNLKDNADLLARYDMFRLIKEIIQCFRVGFHSHISFLYTLKKLKNHIIPLVFIMILLPFSFLLTIYDLVTVHRRAAKNAE